MVLRLREDPTAVWSASPGLRLPRALGVSRTVASEYRGEVEAGLGGEVVLAHPEVVE
jgi:hypothetical protein